MPTLKNTRVNKEDSKKERHPLKLSRFGRAISTLKMSARFGMGASKKMLKMDAKNPEKAIELAVQMANEFDEMKGLMMKFGQMASYLGTHLPEPAREALARLQSSSTAMPFETARSVIESDLGQPLERCFDAFDEEAFAAASIGQVHRAVVDGQPVAVKVQYPDIERLMTFDLALVGRFFSVMFAGMPTNGREIALELRTRIIEECDYELEAMHQHRVRALLLNDPRVTVPKLLTRLSGRHVLTSEYIDALDFKTFCQRATQDAKNSAAETIFRVTFNSIFKHLFFNGDPHPGNYLFSEEGHVTMLDFGCVKKFDVEMMHIWKRIARYTLDGESEKFFSGISEMGIVGHDKRFDRAFHWEVMRALYRPFLSEKAFTYNQAYLSELNRLLLWENKNRFSLKMPADFLFANRLQWGVNAMLADLSATTDWGPLFRAAVDADIEAVFT